MSKFQYFTLINKRKRQICVEKTKKEFDLTGIRTQDLQRVKPACYHCADCRSDIFIKVQKNLAYKLITVSVAQLLVPNPTSLPKSPCQEHSESVVGFFGGPKFTRLDSGEQCLIHFSRFFQTFLQHNNFSACIYYSQSH